MVHQAVDFQAWETLAQRLTHTSVDSNWWWKTLGPHLLILLNGAGYTLDAQVKALSFFYHLVAPSLGPKPMPLSAPFWKSFMTDDHTISSLAGTESDPLNQKATLELLAQLAEAIPGLDLTLFHHFNNALFGPGSVAAQAAGKFSLFRVFEMSRTTGEIAVKAYFVPIETPGGPNAARQIYDTIRSSGCPNLKAVKELKAYLDNDAEGSMIRPILLGIDCVSSAGSRLKIYARSPRTSFDFVRNVMSLGGRRTGLKKEERQLRDLWTRVLGLEPNVSTSVDLPECSHPTAGTLFYFDVSAKDAVPDVKVYIPVRHYSQNDRQVAEGLTSFLQTHRRGGMYTTGYRQAVERLGLSGCGNGETSRGLHTDLMAAYQKGELGITSYFSPQIFNPGAQDTR
ncbi:tryptophan dimethylallyltransferase-domain-containing protein [Podospora australis]|uniref:Tryptophan dimethylallyltransferase-domain-containing protein n=1 Tax=Podospora australis TaxID=1536484 RepID=A0AAN6WIK5_9PEZI|nr:tryptophan dimethylallyltransferase-domain-containing protein [Podospora australis]